ncbi:hypothetical protein GRI89_09355 [Altererythrobacter salegens]|uniref:Uncharacterized protein n=1 Tax=Croceibacterium salegens TaxID=1737568 RepID=A0A6I4SUG0_9SPHN|nr:hypothetical protein [Croceibacterium salegens]MXO59744.1 hypothetical protein [Croceibacterium salegens]
MANTNDRFEDDCCGRRSGTDRRVLKVQIAHPERRRAERRSGSDRRNEPRA